MYKHMQPWKWICKFLMIKSVSDGDTNGNTNGKGNGVSRTVFISVDSIDELQPKIEKADRLLSELKILINEINDTKISLTVSRN